MIDSFLVTLVKGVELTELKACQKKLDRAIKALTEHQLTPCFEIQQVNRGWCINHCERECPDEECWRKLLEVETDDERTES